MKTGFFGYYSPTPEEYERLWKEATIVLDTNVLLNLYRLPASVRDEFLTVLELLKDRLWIPHQVALEFHRNRLAVIDSERKSSEGALNSAQEIVDALRKKVDGLQIDKRGLGIETQPILEDLERANEKLVSAISKAHQAQLDIASADPVRDRLDRLFTSNIGRGPRNQAELDSLTADGDDRYRDRIPPGFADADKGKNPNEAIFVHEHLRYQRKFGDLLLWKQLLEHAKESSVKCVLLVTADRKDDWWWREHGKTIGAHPELISEIRRNSEVELFWMYSSVQFLEHANKYTTARVSNRAVEELQQVVVSGDTYPAYSRFGARVGDEAAGLVDRAGRFAFYGSPRVDYGQIEESFATWLSKKYGDVRRNVRGFPDLIAFDGQDAHGFEIKYLRDFDRMHFSPHLENAALRGCLEVKEGRLSLFTLVIAIEEASFSEIVDGGRRSEVDRRVRRLLEKFPLDSVVVGALVGDRFEVMTWLGRSKTPFGEAEDE